MFTMLVVPLDGSDFAARAIPCALQIAQRAGAGLRLIGIARNDGEVASIHDHVHAAAKNAGQTASDADVIVDPNPVDVLLGIAAEEGALVCLASHDRMRVEAAVLHSVGSSFIARSERPFVVVGERAEPAVDASDVVVALDGVTDPKELLDAAVGTARQLAAPLRLVTVYEPVLADLRDPSHFSRHHGPPSDPDDYLASVARSAEGLGADSVSTASIADPVSVTAGLSDHLAGRPALLLGVGKPRQRELSPGGTVHTLLHRLTTPLFVASHATA
jgi:nucleotide-binding universal stress UspA family protein